MYFNLEVTPKYAVIRNKNTNPTAMKTIIHAQKYRIRQEIREAYKNKNKINLENIQHTFRDTTYSRLCYT